MSRAHWYGIAGGLIHTVALLWLLQHMAEWRTAALWWCVANILWIVGLFLSDTEQQLNGKKHP